MARSLKKGPYVEEALQKKINKMNENSEHKVIKIWSRASMIVPDMLGHTIAVHNGKTHVPVYVTEQMIGHKLGEFSPTRLFKGHAGGAKAKVRQCYAHKLNNDNIRNRTMEAKAKQTDIKMTARKLRRVINEVRGKNVKEAMDMLRFMPYFAARVVEQNLKAAVANAQEKHGLGAESLKVSEIFADESQTFKRGKPRAQGRIYRRLKRTSHLTVKVSDTAKA